MAQSESNTGAGAVVGGLLGAVAGGAIGHKKHKTTEGVLIGGALGALGGAAVGSQIKKTPAATTPEPAAPQKVEPVVQPVAAQTVQAAATAVAAPSKVTLQQVVDWTREGMTSDEIIVRIKATNASFYLVAEDLAFLRKEGVSQRVIDCMQATK
jgi:phage tail tape-measure protein